MTDAALDAELLSWCRVAKAEQGLRGEKAARYNEVIVEMRKRGILLAQKLQKEWEEDQKKHRIWLRTQARLAAARERALANVRTRTRKQIRVRERRKPEPEVRVRTRVRVRERVRREPEKEIRVRERTRIRVRQRTRK